MSTYQQLVAVQLAELPEGKFERWLESNDPPTVNKPGVPLSPDAEGSHSAAKPFSPTSETGLASVQGIALDDSRVR